MYLDYFGFQEEPFAITPNPRFLFHTQKHEDAIESLLYGIDGRKGFLLLTGEIGTGKTTVCRAVLNRLSHHTATSVILNPMLTIPELLMGINMDFGLRVGKTRSVGDQIELLHQFLLEQAEVERNAVVIIDEAQNLSIEALETIRLLSNLETDRQKLLQIVLVGQPELLLALQDHSLRQLNQRISVRQHLAALNHNELREYIFHRLQVAGSRNRIEFKKGAIKMIHKYTNGFPRVANILCDRVLLAAFARRTSTIDHTLVRESIVDLGGKINRIWWRF